MRHSWILIYVLATFNFNCSAVKSIVPSFDKALVYTYNGNEYLSLGQIVDSTNYKLEIVSPNEINQLRINVDLVVRSGTSNIVDDLGPSKILIVFSKDSSTVSFAVIYPESEFVVIDSKVYCDKSNNLYEMLKRFGLEEL